MINYNTFSVIFFIRRKNEIFDEQPIYARITADGKRTELSLKRSVQAHIWDSAKGRARGTGQDVRLLNQYLDQVYTKFLKCHAVLLDRDQLVTAKAIKSLYLGQDEKHKSLKDLITYHNTRMNSVLRPGTMKNYYTTEKYLHSFLEDHLQTDDIYLKRLNYRFISDFELYLRRYKPKRSRRTCTNNGTMKHLERLKKMVNLAVKLEWIPKDPFENFQLKFDKSERQYLNARELKLMEETIFTKPGVERVKNIFLFSCYTGLSYIDIKDLQVDQIVKEAEDQLWIHTKRIKTDESVKIPLLRQAREILSKYQSSSSQRDGFVFPVISNQRVNVYLKEIAKSLGIRKTITFHSARHTFATTVTLANGVPMETVSKLLGHSKLGTTQIYARVLEQKLGEDMEKLEMVLDNNEKWRQQSVQVSNIPGD